MSENQAGQGALPKPGDLLAEKYRIKKLLGRGGMGAVFQAQHEILDRAVAIKFLLPSIAEHPQAVARFLNEARASARLNNEHVAAVLDVGSTPDGGAFMVLEYLEGHDLAETLTARGPLPVSEAVEYVLQSLEALAQAHAAGIVHRDLKPANLFLTRRPDGLPIVKVLDFGISKAATSSNVTATSSMLGSPSYMSPEQIKSSKHVDPRSDIWSMGVVLYQLLSAQLPFKGEGFGEVFAAIFDGSYPPLGTLRPELPQQLCAVIDRCLRQDRGQRFQNVGELADSLKSFAFPTGELCVERIHRLLAAPQIQAAAAAAAAEPLPPPHAAPTPSNLEVPARVRSADPRGDAETVPAPAAQADCATVLRPRSPPHVVTEMVEKQPTAAASSSSDLERLAFPRRRGRWIAAAAIALAAGAAAAVVAIGAFDADPGTSGPVAATPLAPAPTALPPPAAAVPVAPATAPSPGPESPAPAVEARAPAVQPAADLPAAEPVVERPAAPAEPSPEAKPAKAPGRPRPAVQKPPAAVSGDEMLLDRR